MSRNTSSDNKNESPSVIIQDSGNEKFAQQRLLVATPTMGLVRYEWVASRYGQVVPTNWSKTDMISYLSSYIPLRYSVDSAQNLACQEAISKGFDWLLLWEDDTMLPPDGLLKFTEYMDSEEFPLVSGLYFTRSVPAEPLLYRGRGNHYFKDWKLGERIMVDGAPTGCLLINTKLLRLVYEDSAEYRTPDGIVVRRVFETPNRTFFNESTGAQETLVGTSDLDFCNKVIKGDYLARAGWPELAKEKYPICLDSQIQCVHIDRVSGVQYPIGGIEAWCVEHGNI